MRAGLCMMALAFGFLAAGPGFAQAPDPAARAPRWQDLPGWRADHQDEALPALLNSCAILRDLPPDHPLGGAGAAQRRAGTPAAWRGLCEDLAALDRALPDAPQPAPGTTATGPLWQHRLSAWRRQRADRVRAVLERRFEPRPAGRGLMTGYYEPELRGSPVAEGAFRTPLFAPPPELVELPGTDPLRRRFGVMRDGQPEPFLDRATIEGGALAGRGLELAWVDDPVAAFFLHIQGSGRVTLADGSVLRLGYAAQNGQPYVPIGRVLIERAEIPRERMSMQAIRAWLREAGPARAAEVMATNPSFIFFRRLDALAPHQGPIGALGAPLTPGRSIAVDRAAIPLGLPVFVAARDPVDGTPLARLVVAQDTGGDIRGPARTDFFWGWGDAAGERAGLMREDAEVFLLIPRARRGAR